MANPSVRCSRANGARYMPAKPCHVRQPSLRCQASLDAATVTNLTTLNLTYAGLGLGALSFVGTFFGELSVLLLCSPINAFDVF